MEGTFRVKAPVQKLWDILFELDTLRAIVPGAEKIEQLDEKNYDCIVRQKVGPIKVRLKFKATITKVDPPNHVEIEGGGIDLGKAGRFTQKTRVDLKECGEEVEVSYSCNAQIVGKMAMFGDRIMKAKAKQIEKEFTQGLREKMSCV